MNSYLEGQFILLKFEQEFFADIKAILFHIFLNKWYSTVHYTV